jgi:hypothetical protein
MCGRRAENHVFPIRFFGVSKINEPVVTDNNLNYFTALDETGFGSDVFHGPPLGPGRITICLFTYYF